MPKCSSITVLGVSCGRNVANEGDNCAAHQIRPLKRKSDASHGKCELIRYTPSNAEIDNCIYLVTQKHKGALLGAGEQGAAFVFENLVIKISALNSATEEQDWFEEACKSHELGNLAIAPKIYRFFICGKNGFIVMDRITTIKSRKTQSQKQTLELMQSHSDVVRYKEVDADGHVVENIDDIRNLSRVQQCGFITALEIMIIHGYIHMDNHIDNLGFMASRSIVFDFGFTQKRNILDRRWALCFSIFQILEHCPVGILEETVFYRVATACINNTYVWGHPESCIAIPLSELESSEKQLPFLTRLTNEALRSDELSPDLKVGSLAYARIIGQDSRYGAALDLIYLIRNPTHTKNVSKSVIALAAKLQKNNLKNMAPVDRQIGKKGKTG